MTGDRGAGHPVLPRARLGPDGRRPERRLETEGRSWRAIEVWRGGADHGLCYFLPVEDGSASTGDRMDRRATVQPGERLEDLPEERLQGAFDEAVPLTDTERRIRDRGDRLWLVQNVGPVWAEGGVAEGLTGALFTSLEGPLERHARPMGHLAGMDDESLRALLSEPRTGG